MTTAHTKGTWTVRKMLTGIGELRDCFVEAPKADGMAYGLEVLGDDYTGYGDIEGKLADCERIVACVSACESMDNPEEDIAALRNQIKHLSSMLDEAKRTEAILRARLAPSLAAQKEGGVLISISAYSAVGKLLRIDEHITRYAIVAAREQDKLVSDVSRGMWYKLKNYREE